MIPRASPRGTRANSEGSQLGLSPLLAQPPGCAPLGGTLLPIRIGPEERRRRGWGPLGDSLPLLRVLLLVWAKEFSSPFSEPQAAVAQPCPVWFR